MALWITAEQEFFLLSVLLLFFLGFCRNWLSGVETTPGRGGRRERALRVLRCPGYFRAAGKKNAAGRAAFFMGLTVLLGLFLGAWLMQGEKSRFRREEAVCGGVWEEAEQAGEMEAVEAGSRPGAGTLRVSGTLSNIEETENGWRLTLRDCRVGEREWPVRRMFCYTDTAEGLKIGQRLLAGGTVEAAGAARNPGGFDYRLYCRGKGIGGLVYAEWVRITDSRSQRLLEGLRRLREYLGGQLLTYAGPEDGGTLMAVLLGSRKELSASVYELYRRNGISHLLAISGLHVSIIGMGLWKGLRRGGVGFWAAGSLAFGFLALYGVLAGAGPSVVRAVSMMGLSFLAAAFGRTYDLPSAMCIPALLLLGRFPYLLTQAGFQLSFLAVGAIFWPGGALTRLGAALGTAGAGGRKRMETAQEEGDGGIRKVAQGLRRGLLQGFLVSASIQAVTAPVILYHSFELPVYGVFLNLIVIPLMTCVVVSGLLGLFGSFFWPVWGSALFGGAHYILAFYGLLCEWTEGLPFSSLALGRPGFWQMALYYGLLAAGVLAVCGKEKEDGRGTAAGRRRALALSLWLAGLLALVPVPSGGLSVTFLDVGQGDGIFLRTAGGTFLVDCGSTQEKEIGEDCLVPFLKSQGVTRLDTVVVSHGDWDHISGIRHILEEPESGIQLQKLILPRRGEGEAYEKLAELALSRGTEVVLLEKGDCIPFPGEDEIQFSCLYPSEESRCESRNEESLVLRLDYDRFSMLLTGDIEAGGEGVLLENGSLAPVTVLKAAHHGSSTSSCEAFLEAVSPSLAILSYGEKNRYGHPSGAVVERLRGIGAEIHETAVSGAITVWTNGRRMRVRSMLADSG